MPPAIIAAGIGAIGVLGGAEIASSANKEAAKTQAGSTQQGLDFEKSVYQQRRQDLQPAIGLGAGAMNSLSSLYGFSRPPAPSVPYNGQSPFSPTGGQNLDPGSVQRYQPIAPQDQRPSGSGATSGMVTMRAPTGETQQVPASLVSFYQGKGAQLVQGAS